jgi:hypothetical protein
MNQGLVNLSRQGLGAFRSYVPLIFELWRPPQVPQTAQATSSLRTPSKLTSLVMTITIELSDHSV